MFVWCGKQLKNSDLHLNIDGIVVFPFRTQKKTENRYDDNVIVAGGNEGRHYDNFQNPEYHLASIALPIFVSTRPKLNNVYAGVISPNLPVRQPDPICHTHTLTHCLRRCNTPKMLKPVKARKYNSSSFLIQNSGINHLVVGCIQRETFSNDFIVCKLLHFDTNFTEVSSWGSNWQYVNIGSGKWPGAERATDIYIIRS